MSHIEVHELACRNNTPSKLNVSFSHEVRLSLVMIRFGAIVTVGQYSLVCCGRKSSKVRDVVGERVLPYVSCC